MSDFDLLVRAGRLYYELGETQGRIADLLGVTRPQVSRLLKRARDEGIVEIRIVDRMSDDSPAGETLRSRFGLSAVHMAPSLAGPEELNRRMIARLAAQVTRAAVRDGAMVGVGDGAAISATADAMLESTTPVSATVVPLCGGYWTTGLSREPFRRVAEALGASANGLLAPGLVDDAATKRSLYAHAGVQAILALWERLDVAIYGIGAGTWSPATFGEAVVGELTDAAAVGELLIAPFDIEGRFLGESLRDRVIAYDARDLSRVPVSIGVSGGQAKVQPILGALRSGVVNVLVTDIRTAEAVVDLDDALRAAEAAGVESRSTRAGATKSAVTPRRQA